MCGAQKRKKGSAGSCTAMAASTRSTKISSSYTQPVCIFCVHVHELLSLFAPSVVSHRSTTDCLLHSPPSMLVQYCAGKGCPGRRGGRFRGERSASGRSGAVARTYVVGVVEIIERSVVPAALRRVVLRGHARVPFACHVRLISRSLELHRHRRHVARNAREARDRVARVPDRHVVIEHVHVDLRAGGAHKKVRLGNKSQWREQRVGPARARVLAGRRPLCSELRVGLQYLWT